MGLIRRGKGKEGVFNDGESTSSLVLDLGLKVGVDFASALR